MVLEDEDPDGELVGRIGRITVPVPAGGPGEVVIPIRGGSEAFAAYCDEPVPKHRQVVVVEERSARSVLVTPLPESIFPTR